LRRNPDPDSLRLYPSGGGVGYFCHIPFSTFRAIKDRPSPVTLWTHTHVREDILALYGFATESEREVFQRLIALNGVGPKVALCVLSGLGAEEIVRAVQNQDVAVLASIPGIGPKTANRIIFELKGKLDDTLPGTPSSSMRSDALSALENLGYRSIQAARAVDAVLQRSGDMDLEGILVEALKDLSR